MSNALLKNGCDVNSDVVALESFDSIQFCSCDISVLPKAVVKVKFLFLLSEKPSLLLLILYVEKRSNTDPEFDSLYIGGPQAQIMSRCR